ncbi:hypothetical protein [Vibrio metschnikovii]|uniref:hypothetical protein n=1 Tax=Vibrio metschnikovii TaxID=28172 RepID=UPI001C2FCB37|nr:hypothetical protein [Vibrio metschnikovii]MDA3140379.1 hypothetical protein [Vibrio metschnikovii]
MEKNTINEYYDEFIQKVADISLMQRVVDDAFKREMKVLMEYEFKERSSDIIRHDALGYHNLFTGKLEKYAFRKTTVSDLIRMTFIHKNTQYCWLMASAFECFEKFIKHVYLYASNNNEVHKLCLRKILSFISDNNGNIKRYEKNNTSGIHLKVAVLFIEKLRHAIVHAQGFIGSEVNELVSKIFKESGVVNDGNRHVHEDFIKQYIKDRHIILVEVPIETQGRLPLYHNTYTHLVSYLIGYAGLVNKYIE